MHLLGIAGHRHPEIRSKRQTMLRATNAMEKGSLERARFFASSEPDGVGGNRVTFCISHQDQRTCVLEGAGLDIINIIFISHTGIKPRLQSNLLHTPTFYLVYSPLLS
ncbi:hypothetical protein ElyMa_002613900 [Elysia marginata]|uniref:Peptidase M12A domain-containing protein n=1 Tax=Elysia marginata TaxID=1093978 RepID=A0AAV4H6L1_9GAST|nr:hypothetical protein ElyMa_002613900 [Elysia marginata]